MSKFIELTLMNTEQVTVNLDHVLFVSRWGVEGIQFKFTNGETLIATHNDPSAFLTSLHQGNLP